MAAPRQIREAVVRDDLAGDGCAPIGARHGVSATTVLRWVREAAFQPWPQGTRVRIVVDLEEAAKRYAAGESCVAIPPSMGISPVHLRRLLLRHGVTLLRGRPRGPRGHRLSSGEFRNEASPLRDAAGEPSWPDGRELLGQLIEAATALSETRFGSRRRCTARGGRPSGWRAPSCVATSWTRRRRA